MYICYYDESGDDGYPEYSSPLFVLSVVYMHHLNWKENYESIHHFRQHLKESFGIHVKWEWKAKKFILNKNPYRELGLDTNQRLNIKSQYCDFISVLKLRIINVVINKSRITSTTYHGRMPEEIDIAKVLEWMELAKPVLNLEASSKDEYGVVCYPS